MNKTIAYCSLLAVGAFLATVTVCRPNVLSDDNAFLLHLVDKDLLLVLGVVLTITLASAGQLHLALNEIESKVGRPFLQKTRAGVHSSAYFLIALFLGGVVVVTTKQYFLSWAIGQAAFNSAALFIMFWMVLIMTSLSPEPSLPSNLTSRSSRASQSRQSHGLDPKNRQNGQKERDRERSPNQFSRDGILGLFHPVGIQPVSQFFVTDPGPLQLRLDISARFDRPFLFPVRGWQRRGVLQPDAPGRDRPSPPYRRGVSGPVCARGGVS